ncbi:MAG: hypothetical protein IJC76_08670 [Lachnospiraceae bacterium]|nr:hypothetical protein [Lachnospiraceae bacterium]
MNKKLEFNTSLTSLIELAAANANTLTTKQIENEFAIQSVIDEEIDAGRIGKHLADRANALDRFSTEFAKENGREATLEELAYGMGLPEEEIRNILKYSLDALNSTGEE